MALRARGWRVAFLDPNVALDDAQRAAAADEKVESLSGADLVILATPVDVAVGILRTQEDVHLQRDVAAARSRRRPFRRRPSAGRLTRKRPLRRTRRSLPQRGL